RDCAKDVGDRSLALTRVLEPPRELSGVGGLCHCPRKYLAARSGRAQRPVRKQIPCDDPPPRPTRRARLPVVGRQKAGASRRSRLACQSERKAKRAKRKNSGRTPPSARPVGTHVPPADSPTGSLRTVPRIHGGCGGACGPPAGARPRDTETM